MLQSIPRFRPVTFQQLMGNDLEPTEVSRRLHRQALAYFEDNPEKTAFFRPVYDGEFTNAQMTKLAQVLRGRPMYVYVESGRPHHTDSIPLSPGMYQALLRDLRDVPLIGGLDTYREHTCAEHQ